MDARGILYLQFLIYKMLAFCWNNKRISLNMFTQSGTGDNVELNAFFVTASKKLETVVIHLALMRAHTSDE